MNFWNRLGELSEIMIVEKGEKRDLFHKVFAQVRALDALLPPMACDWASELYVKKGIVHTRYTGKFLSDALISMDEAELLNVRDVALPELVEELILTFAVRRV